MQEQQKVQKSICLVIIYMGKWPIWFPAFLRSCALNPSVDWRIYTDCEIPESGPGNVTFISTNTADVNALANDRIGMEIPITSPRKFCDLKPTYGTIFHRDLEKYDFWGFCDMDVIWGDIRKYMSDDILSKYDVITTRKNAIAGHFTLVKNRPEVTDLFRTNDLYIESFAKTEYMWFDESTYENIIRDLEESGKVSVLWDRFLVNTERGSAHQEYHLDRWEFDHGKLYKLDKNLNRINEEMYLHFINWKPFMKVCEVTGSEDVFYVSYIGIRLKPHSGFQRMVQRIRNYFFGYWARQKTLRTRKKTKKKLNNIKKRFNAT